MSEQNRKNSKLWGGRFTGEASKLLWKYNASIDLDKRLWQEGRTIPIALQYVNYCFRFEW